MLPLSQRARVPPAAAAAAAGAVAEAAAAEAGADSAGAGARAGDGRGARRRSAPRARRRSGRDGRRDREPDLRVGGAMISVGVFSKLAGEAAPFGVLGLGLAGLLLDVWAEPAWRAAAAAPR